MRQALVINDNKYPDAFLKIITRHKLTDAIKEGTFNKDSFHKKIFSSEDLTHFISGKKWKNFYLKLKI